jgi:hypothetical protein
LSVKPIEELQTIFEVKVNDNLHVAVCPKAVSLRSQVLPDLFVIVYLAVAKEHYVAVVAVKWLMPVSNIYNT